MAGKDKKETLSFDEQLALVVVPKSEHPYEIPPNWVWINLSAFAECLDNLRRPINANERALRTGDIPYYGATGQIGWIDDYLTNENLVLIGEDGAPFFDYLKNKAYLIDGKAWVNNHAHILRSFFGLYGNKFLMHYLNIFDYKGYVNGTTRLKLTKGSMNDIPVPLPPIGEQQRIVDKIEGLFAKLDSVKELVQPILDSFEGRRSAILYRAFIGELTVNWREVNKVRADSWMNYQLSEILDYVTSGSRGWSKYYSNEGAIFIRMGNLLHGTIELDLSDIQYVSLPDNVEGKRSKIQHGDILISITADIGRIAVISDNYLEAYINQHIALLRPIKGVCPEYIAWYLVSDLGLEQLQEKQRGVTKAGLSLADIKLLNIKIPTIVEQHEIVRILNQYFEKEKRAKELCSILDQIEKMKKVILTSAFHGELDTNNSIEESARELLKQIAIERKNDKSGLPTYSIIKEVELMYQDMVTALKENGRMTPETLKRKMNIDIDEYYEQLKDSVQKGLIIEVRQENEIFLEAL